MRVTVSGYLETIRTTRPANGTRWKILVVDAFAKAHLNHVLKVYDILEEGVQRELVHPEARPVGVSRRTRGMTVAAAGGGWSNTRDR